MKKVPIVISLALLLILILSASAQAKNPEQSNQASAQAVYSPTINSKSYGGSFAYTPSNLILPEGAGSHAIPNSKEEIYRPRGMEEVPVDVLRPRPRGWDVFSKPYKSSILFREKENDKPIKLLPGFPLNARLLGTVTITDYWTFIKEEVLIQTLYYAKELTFTSNVVAVKRKVPIPTGTHKGLGTNGVTAEVTDNYTKGITASGSGIWSSSKGWVDFGVQITIYCYEDLPEHVATVSFCQTSPAENQNLAQEIASDYTPGKKVYFIAYQLQEEDRKQALERARKTASKAAGHLKQNLVKEFQLLTPPYAPRESKIKGKKIIDIVVANQGFEVKKNPHLNSKK